MVLCFIALPVFLILGIFSVKYRILARDALDCLGRTITFRKCKSGLDDRIKSHVTGKVIKKNHKLGLFIYKNFQLFSIIFIIILIISLVFSITGYANYLKYGNCNGPEDDGSFCVYEEILGGDTCDHPEECTNDACNCESGSNCICDSGTCKN
tara:strand:+ start:1771 stop:2229 length:459 start_codon:yes stop_codon:yes gene_type:complete